MHFINFYCNSIIFEYYWYTKPPKQLKTRLLKNICTILFLISFLLSEKSFGQSFTFSANTGGVATDTIRNGQTANILYSFGAIQSSGSAVPIGEMNISSNNNPQGYFTNAKLYISTSSTYSTSATQITSASIQFNSGSINISGISTTLSSGVKYYFFIMADMSVSYGTIPSSLQFSLTNLTYNSAGKTYTNSNTTTGTNNILASPLITVQALTGGISSSPIVNGQTGLVLFGFAVTVKGALTVNDYNITSTNNAQAIFTNGKLYRSTTSNTYPTGFTQVGTSSVNIYSTYTQFSLSTAETFPGATTTVYYYFVADFTGTCNSSSNIQFGISSTQSNPEFTIGPSYVQYNSVNNISSTLYNVGTTYNWRGGTSTDWGNVNNYSTLCGGTPSVLPGQYDVVQIGVVGYTNPAYQPTISSTTTNTTISQLIFGSNNTPQLTINTGKTLTVSNGMTVNSSGLGTVYGPGTLNLGGASVVNSSGTFTAGPTSIISLNNNASTLTNSGTFNLLSDATGSANIAAIPSGGTAAFNGLFNVQRFMTGGTAKTGTTYTYRSYRLLSSPVNNVSPTSGSANYINFRTLNLPYTVAGTTYYGAFTAGTGAGFSISNPNPTLYLYQETLNPSTATNSVSFTSGKYVGITSLSPTSNSVGTTVTTNGITTTATTSVPVGNGFLLYFIGSSNPAVRTTGSSSIAPDNTTITNVGYLNQQNVTVDLWYAPTGGTLGNSKLSYSGAVTGFLSTNFAGYNMVGNPYASTLDLKALYTDNYNATSNKISSNFYELTDTSPGQAYVVYSASGGNSGSLYSEYVVSGQGFMTVATATGQSLVFKEDQKVYNNTLTPTSTPPLDLSLRRPNAALKTDAVIEPDTLSGLHMMLQKDSVTYHECGIYYCKHCSDNYDQFDAYDLDGISPLLYMSSYTADGVRTALNKMGDYIKGKSVKLFIKASTDGLYKLNLADIQNIDTSAYNVYLIDRKKNDSLDMVRYKSYAFNITIADTTTYGANRFVLNIERKPLPPYQLISFTGQKVNNGVQLNWKTYNEGNYTGFVLEKQTAGNQYTALDSLQSNGNSLYNYTDQKPVTGNNTYRLKQNDINGNITYSSPITIVYDPVSAGGIFSIYPNPSKELITITVSTNSSTAPNYFANIYNTSGALLVHRAINANSWTEDITSYSTGIYIIELKTTDGNLVGKSKFVKTN